MTEQVMDLSKYDGDGYDDVVVTIKQSKKFGRRRYFTSNKQNSFIVNAETGSTYSFRVGSNESRYLFKIVDTTGVCDSNGYELNPRDESYPNRNPNHIFYDNPEQFEKHQKILLSHVIQEKWYKKNMECRLQNLKYRNDNE